MDGGAAWHCGVLLTGSSNLGDYRDIAGELHTRRIASTSIVAPSGLTLPTAGVNACVLIFRADELEASV